MNAQKAHASDMVQQNVRIENGMFTNIRTMLRQEEFRAATTFGLQHGQKGPFRRTPAAAIDPQRCLGAATAYCEHQDRPPLIL
jgi:hypothetical protein